MRFIAGCTFSAVLGGLLAAWLTGSGPHDGARAQDSPARSGPSFPAPDGPDEHDRPAPRPAGPPVVDANGLSPDEAVNVSVYETCNKSVVNITTKTTDGFLLVDVTSEGSGSGSVVDRDGHILTNFHVVEEARQVGATLFNGKTYEATLVGADPINDLAVLKVDAPRDVLHPLSLGDSSRLRVGMRVFAIGNPFGLERTMTTGIISSLNRSLQVRGNRTIRSIIQIDAAVNPGNSGGPLIDSHGRLIGINTAIASRNGQSSGVGFAIPSNLIARVVPQLIRHGRVIRPEIGIQRVFETDSGLFIARLTPGGPAERAGLRGPRITRSRRGIFMMERVDRSAADLIVGVDGQAVKTADDFLGYIEGKKAGDRISLTVVRDGREIEIPVTLGGGGESQNTN